MDGTHNISTILTLKAPEQQQQQLNWWIIPIDWVSVDNFGWVIEEWIQFWMLDHQFYQLILGLYIELAYRSIPIISKLDTFFYVFRWSFLSIIYMDIWK